MKKKTITLLICIVNLFLASCSPNVSEPVETQTNIYFEATHGVTSLDILSDKLIYDGEVLSIDYSFKNGNVDANYGLLLFLDGVLQPYYTNVSSQYSHMHIFQIKKNSEKTFQLLFQPVVGQYSQELPLHIVAIFDANTSYNNPTLSNSFWQSLSQAFPLTVLFNTTSTFNEHLLDTQGLKKYSLNIESIQENSLTTKNTDIIKPVIEIDTNYLRKNEEFQIYLSGSDDSQRVYRLYAFINNAPILIEGNQWYEIEIDKQQSKVISSSFNVIDDSGSNEDYFFILAVPMHSISDNNSGMNVLKTKSLSINNN